MVPVQKAEPPEEAGGWLADEADWRDGSAGEVAVDEEELDEPGYEGLEDYGYCCVAGEGGGEGPEGYWRVGGLGGCVHCWWGELVDG